LAEAEKKLLMYIVKGLIGLCSSLICILGWCLKTLIKQGKQKKFYKEICLAKTVKDEHELTVLRQTHDNYIKTGEME